jgi:hypothetical protein
LTTRRGGIKPGLAMLALVALALAGCGDETASVDPKTWPDKWCQVAIG